MKDKARRRLNRLGTGLIVTSFVFGALGGAANAGTSGLEVLDGPDNVATGQIDNIANTYDTVAGSALQVRVDLDAATVLGIATVTVKVTDGTHTVSTVKQMQAAGSAASRTVSLNVKTMNEKLLTVTSHAVAGTVVADATGYTNYDITPPKTTFTSPLEGDAFQKTNVHLSVVPDTIVVDADVALLPISYVAPGDITFKGKSVDTAHGIQWVYVTGHNTTNGQTFAKNAQRSTRDQMLNQTWSQKVFLQSGAWVIKACAQDLAGNIETKCDTAYVTVYAQYL